MELYGEPTTPLQAFTNDRSATGARAAGQLLLATAFSTARTDFSKDVGQGLMVRQNLGTLL